MLNQDQVREVIGSTAYGSDGEKIGKVGNLFLDDQTGAPEFVTVNTGFFGSNESSRSRTPRSRAIGWSCRSARTR
jgi:sporulation protein YlmC with PRC-barrel domain